MNAARRDERIENQEKKRYLKFNGNEKAYLNEIKAEVAKEIEEYEIAL